MKCSRQQSLGPVLRLIFCAAIVFAAASEVGAQTYMFDIDHADTPATAPGWISFPVGNAATSASLNVDGIDFTIASADGARLRLSGSDPTPDALMADFAFDDGANQAIIFGFGSAGQLPADLWSVEVYSWEAGLTSAGAPIPVGDQIVGLRKDGVETILTSNAVATPTGPMYSFQFVSDGVSTYDFFLRENSGNNRTRLNAVVLSRVPEPATVGLLAAAGVALVGYRRWRK